MRTYLSIAAVVLGGAMFIGCDKKDNTATTPPATPPAVNTPTVTMPDTTKMTDKANQAITNGTDAAKVEMDKAADAARTEKDKLMSTTMPSTPAMPK